MQWFYGLIKMIIITVPVVHNCECGIERLVVIIIVNFIMFTTTRLLSIIGVKIRTSVHLAVIFPGSSS